MSAEIAAGVILTGDGRDLVLAAKESGDALKKLQGNVQDLSTESRKLASAQPPVVSAVGQTERSFNAGADAAKKFEDGQRGLSATGIALATTLTTFAVQAVMKFANSLVESSRRAIESGAEVARLAEKYAISAETISTLKFAADVSDTTISQVTAGLDRMTRNAVQAGRGLGEARLAFQALNVDVKDSAGQLKSQERLLYEVAEAISKVEDNTTKAALAQMIFGRSGAELLPFLNNGARGLQNLQEQGRKWAEISSVNATEAKKLKDQQVELDYASQALGKNIATVLVPALNGALTAFLNAKRGGEGFFTAMQRGMQGMLGRTDITDAQRELVSNTDKMLKAQDQVDRARASGASKTTINQLEERVKGFEARAKAAQALLTVNEPDFVNPATPRVTDGGKTQLPDKPDRTGAARISDYERLTIAIKEKIAAEQLEFDSGEKLTEVQRFLARLQVDLAQGKIKMLPAQKAELEALAATWQALDAGNTARTKTLRLNDDARKALEQHLQVMERDVRTVETSNLRMAEHNEEIGLTAQQLGALKVVRAEATVAIARQAEAEGLLNGVSERELELLTRRRREAERTVDLTRDQGARTAAAEAWRKQEDDARRATENMERTLTDGLMRSFEAGKDASASFWDTVKNAARATILQPVVRMFVEPIARPLAQVAQGFSNAASSFISNLMGSAQGGFGANWDSLAGWVSHTGSGPGDVMPTRMMPASTWSGAPRFHSGIGPNERAAIITKDESVLTPGQMRQLAPVGSGAGSGSISVEIKNQGTPQQVTSATPRFDGERMVIDIVTRDLTQNGPISQGMQGRFNLRMAS